MSETNPNVKVSAFLDEGSEKEAEKHLHEQLLIGKAIGVKYWTPRFIFDPLLGGNVNILKLSDGQIKNIVKQSQDAGFQIGCIGTAVGKEKLENVEDKNPAPYTTLEQSLAGMDRAIAVAQMAGAKFIRAFSFYGIRGQSPDNFYQQALDRLGPMAEKCKKAGIIYLIELEPGLVGYKAENAVRLCKDINNPHLLICPDAANSHVQGLNAATEYRTVAEAGKLGLMHIKDYKVACPQAIVVNEEALANFCSVADGIVGHREILNDLRSRLLSIDAMLTGLGAPGLILDVEGHMKGGGQFGGWSGPDGLGVATRALTSMLDQVGTAYVMRYDKDVAKKEVVHK